MKIAVDIAVKVSVQWSEDVIKTDPFFGFDYACPPGFPTQLHVTTTLSTGGGPVSSVQLSEGGFQVVYPLGLWSQSSGVVKVFFTWIWLVNCLHLHYNGRTLVVEIGGWGRGGPRNGNEHNTDVGGGSGRCRDSVRVGLQVQIHSPASCPWRSRIILQGCRSEQDAPEEPAAHQGAPAIGQVVRCRV